MNVFLRGWCRGLLQRLLHSEQRTTNKQFVGSDPGKLSAGAALRLCGLRHGTVVARVEGFG